MFAAIYVFLFGRPAPLPAPIVPPSPEEEIAGASPEMPELPPPPMDPAYWRRLVVDRGVMAFVEGLGTSVRFEIYSSAITMPIEEYKTRVQARYTKILGRNEFGDRPFEIREYAAAVQNHVLLHPAAAGELDRLDRLATEAERRAKIARARKRAHEKEQAARGMAAILAAATLVGKSMPTADPKAAEARASAPDTT